eukprot:gi/632984848/ref/XP_007909352.1/ PREDICTED: protein NDRG1-like isoform X2 [Callorhinchus milii]
MQPTEQMDHPDLSDHDLQYQLSKMTEEAPGYQLTEHKPLLGNVLNFEENDSVEHVVETSCGSVQITVRGIPRPKRPVILTFHDIGLNHKSCFNSLFNFEDMQEIVRHFAVCHVDAPGQEMGAKNFPQGYHYPTMDQLADILPQILKHFNVTSIIGLGVGAGAFILTKFALAHPDLVEGLCLININPCAEGWMDWAASKLTGLTGALDDVVISHLFSKEEVHNNLGMIQTYRHHISHDINQTNLHHFINSYNHRRDLDIERPVAGMHNYMTLKCHSLLVVGDSSPAVDAVVECNTRLDPTKTTLLKMSDCGGLPQVVQPAKLTEAFKYFVQGMGHMPGASMTRLMRSRTGSASSYTSIDSNRSRAHTGEGNRSRAHTLENTNMSQAAMESPLSSSPRSATMEHSGPQSAEVSC